LHYKFYPGSEGRVYEDSETFDCRPKEGFVNRLSLLVEEMMVKSIVPTKLILIVQTEIPGIYVHEQLVPPQRLEDGRGPDAQGLVNI